MPTCKCRCHRNIWQGHRMRAETMCCVHCPVCDDNVTDRYNEHIAEHNEKLKQLLIKEGLYREPTAK